MFFGDLINTMCRHTSRFNITHLGDVCNSSLRQALNNLYGSLMSYLALREGRIIMVWKQYEDRGLSSLTQEILMFTKKFVNTFVPWGS